MLKQIDNSPAAPPPNAASRTMRQRILDCVRNAIPSAIRTALWLIRITVPLSFAVLVMKLTGVLPLIGRLFEPVFGVLGLPGEAAIVFVTACLVNIYSCIVVIETLDLTGRVVTILALMCLISHNLPMECAVQKKTGSSFLRMLLLRLACSFVGALLLNLLLPADASIAQKIAARATATSGSFATQVGEWFLDTTYLCAKILVLVTLLMILERLLHEFGVTRVLARWMRGPLKLLGLPGETAFLWIVANVLGLAYGAGVLVEHVERGDLSRDHADALNHHIAISHSLLEDTLLFVAIGVSAAWITFPRILLAAAVVWLRRAINQLTPVRP